MPAMVSHDIYAKVATRGDLLIWANLLYLRTDPLGIRLTAFASDPRPRPWMFSRDLLIEGMQGLAGEGDVIVMPHGDREISITLRASQHGDHDIVLLIPRLVIDRFLTDTVRVVRVGDEARHLTPRIDAELTALLGGK